MQHYPVKESHFKATKAKIEKIWPDQATTGNVEVRLQTTCVWLSSFETLYIKLEFRPTNDEIEQLKRITREAKILYELNWLNRDR